MKVRDNSVRLRVTLYRLNGDLKYKGEMKSDKFDGWGEAHYKNKDIYVGYWQAGRRHGYGEHRAVGQDGSLKEIFAGKYNCHLNLLHIKSKLTPSKNSL